MLPARVGLGVMRLATDDGADEPRARAVVHAALDAGLGVFDTARAYGESERWLAAALATHAAGARAFVITKGGMARPDGQWRADGRAATLRADCAASLAALGRPIDLYLVHAPDPRVAFATTLRALARLAEEGLVRAVGVSNVRLAQLDEALRLAPITAVEVAFNLLDDLPLRSGVLARCRQRGLTLVAHSPLGGPRRAARLLATPSLVARARRHDVAPATLALAALLDVAPEVAVIPGARRPEAVAALAAAADLRLDDADRAALAADFPSLRAALPRVSAARADGEVVLVMGLPGAGKSVAAARWSDAGYERLNRDELGGSLRGLAQRLDERLRAGVRRLVLDNTYVTRAARAEVLATAARHGVAVRGVWLDVPLADAQVNVVGRMLEAHRRLLSPDELRRGRDNTALSPLALFRLARTLEPPADDEGFATLERLSFTRLPSSAGARPARLVAHELADALPPDELATSFVFGWAPDAPSPAASLAARAAAVALCPHGGGPPVCWCRPPLPGLLLALAHAHGLDLARSDVVGRGRAHATLAAAVGARFVAR